MDYFITAIALGAMTVWLWNGVEDRTVFLGVLGIGFAELILER